ncbi:hypothetical protein [Shewanella sp. UCD-KL12]|uniref:hypothetical protein n=1 Tax=Shewanella sp. UCD-KL12 TaxID=1917163 RepID=UPI000970C8EA|nr:hypothetical protein [Shewanella sp. UCD-KL12]
MDLSDKRREISIISLTTAASMIEDYVSSGVTTEDIDLSDDEIEMLGTENKKRLLNYELWQQN